MAEPPYIGEEGIPFVADEDDRQPVRSFGIPHSNLSTVQVRDLYAVVAAATVAGLEPCGIRQRQPSGGARRYRGTARHSTRRIYLHTA